MSTAYVINLSERHTSSQELYPVNSDATPSSVSDLFAAAHTLAAPLPSKESAVTSNKSVANGENVPELSEMSVTNISLWDESIVSEWLSARGLASLCGDLLKY